MEKNFKEFLKQKTYTNWGITSMMEEIKKSCVEIATEGGADARIVLYSNSPERADGDINLEYHQFLDGNAVADTLVEEIQKLGLEAKNQGKLEIYVSWL